ncbi:MAG: DoxX family membrane protein [Gammaproteobacteria bacterium]|nr:DoxX family membrane protein [Gammaproteobacteria bacterium]
MSDAAVQAAGTARPRFSFALVRSRPALGTGIGFIVVLRILYGLMWAGGAVNKFQRDYLFSDFPLKLFTQRLTELDPASFSARFLEGFVIPNSQLVGWIVAWGEVAIAVGLVFGFMTRIAGFGSALMCIMFGIGGYYDASLIPLILIGVLIMVLPTGHWLGLDRRLHQRYPNAIWFK